MLDLCMLSISKDCHFYILVGAGMRFLEIAKQLITPYTSKAGRSFMSKWWHSEHLLAIWLVEYLLVINGT